MTDVELKLPTIEHAIAVQVVDHSIIFLQAQEHLPWVEMEFVASRLQDYSESLFKEWGLHVRFVVLDKSFGVVKAPPAFVTYGEESSDGV